MNILAPPRPPVVNAALAQAHAWCAGHQIDQAPAVQHAVAVTVTLGRHHPEIHPEVLAATLLHDSPEFAPADLDLDRVLTKRFGPLTCRVVRGLEAIHLDMRPGAEPVLDFDEPAIVQAAAADKIVAIDSMLRRAGRAPDPATFWQRRQAFVQMLDYFEAFRAAAAPVCEADMIDRLADLLTQAHTESHPYAGCS